MADWIKVEKLTPDKPEIAILARKLGVSIGDAFLQWFRLYSWADGISEDGHVRFLSASDADILAKVMPRTTEHLASPEINWVRIGSDGLHFLKWDRHNGKSAKRRALDAERKQAHRGSEDGESAKCPHPKRTSCGQNADQTRGDERRNQSSKGDRKTIGSVTSPVGEPGSAASRSSRSLRSGRSPKDARGEEGSKQEPFDLSGVDWPHVIALAESAAKRVKPCTDGDRRAWLRFGVLAEMAFGEAWLIDAAEAVVNATETKRTRQAHFVAVLKRKAAEQHGVDEANFVAMLRRIEIPAEIWKSSVVEVRQ